jgi:hypothetical protein
MPLFRRALRILCALVLLACGISVLYFFTSRSPGAVNKDCTQYWASANLLLHHVNPYDQAGVFRLEEQAGMRGRQIMFNLPCTLFFVLPLGLLTARLAIFLWSLTIIATLILSVRFLWVMNGQRTDGLDLLAYIFAPVMASIVLGQIVPIALLGFLLFLWLHDTRPLLAGLFLSLLEVKPHLFLPFVPVLLVWVFKQKQYRVLAGALLGFAITFSVPLYFDRQILQQYIPVLHSANTLSNTLPNLSSIVHSIHPQYGWLQYALAIGGSCWAIARFLRKQQNWDWKEEGPLLLAVCFLVAPYSWFEDEILMLPAVLSGIYFCADYDRSLLMFVLLDAVAFALSLFVNFGTGAYIWMGLAWFVWIIYTRSFPARFASSFVQA